MTEIITKAELSRRLGISKARVSQLVAKGLPVNEDGRVNADIALNWLNTHSRSALNGKGVLAGAQKALVARDMNMPPHFAFIPALVSPIDRIAVLTALQLVYRAPALASLAAQEHGASAETAKAMFYPLAVILMEEAADILKALGCEPFASQEEPVAWDGDAFSKVDWSKLS